MLWMIENGLRSGIYIMLFIDIQKVAANINK